MLPHNTTYTQEVSCTTFMAESTETIRTTHCQHEGIRRDEDGHGRRTLQVTVEVPDAKLAWRTIEERYDSLDGGVVVAMEELLVAMKRNTFSSWSAAVQLVDDIARLAACGDAEALECTRCGIPALLTKMVVAVSTRQSESEEEEVFTEHLCVAIANCSGTTARHGSDVVTNLCDSHHPYRDVLGVRIGFADYAACETAAMLWAGAVNMSLRLWAQNIPGQEWAAAALRERRTWRVIELGCGGALVSSVIMRLLCTVQSLHPISDEVGERVDVPTPLVHLSVTDAAVAAVERAKQTIASAAEAAHDDCFQWECYPLDFGDIPERLKGSFDIVVASDIVYDYRIGALVPPALVALLRPGTGVAHICCEDHRDGMKEFIKVLTGGHQQELEVTDMCRPIDVCSNEGIAVSLPKHINQNCTWVSIRRRQ